MKDRESIESQALVYIEEKYNEKFNVVDSFPSGMDVPYDEIILYSSAYPNDEVIVYREKIGGEYHFFDNYFGIIKKSEYAQKLESNALKVFSDCKIYFEFISDFFDDSYIASTDLSEVMRKNKTAFDSNIRVFISADDIASNEYETKSEEFLELLRKENYFATVQICCIELDLYVLIDESNYVDVINENYNSITKTETVVK